MFEGEFASLKAIRATNTVRAPEPIKVLSDAKHGSMLVMEFLEGLGGLGSAGAKLGDQLAEMHLYVDVKGNPSGKFGFDIPTCCGSIPQSNTWCDDWPVCQNQRVSISPKDVGTYSLFFKIDFLQTFYTNKLQEQMDLLDKNERDAEAKELWGRLKPTIPSFFEGITIKPSLLHGDMWSGNVASIDGNPGT